MSADIKGLTATLVLAIACASLGAQAPAPRASRERISINDGWRFTKDHPSAHTGRLLYDVRPEVTYDMDGRPADAEPRPPEEVAALAQAAMKLWITSVAVSEIPVHGGRYPEHP